MTRLLLVRHAETVWHAENRYAGSRSEPELTDVGLRQADQLAATAVALGVGAVVSSPQRRAVATAVPAAEALGVPLHRRPDLREVDFGDLEGRLLSAMDSGKTERFRSNPEANAFPNAEPLAAAGARGAAALRAIDDEYSTNRPVSGSSPRTNDAVLVVAHSTLLRVTLCVLLGIPVQHYRRVFPALENVAVTEIRLPADPTRPASLLSLNRAH